MADVTKENVVLKPYKNGQMGKSSYAFDWIEKINYYVDLSNSSIWDVNHDTNKVSINLDKIKEYINKQTTTSDEKNGEKQVVE